MLFFVAVNGEGGIFWFYLQQLTSVFVYLVTTYKYIGVHINYICKDFCFSFVKDMWKTTLWFGWVEFIILCSVFLSHVSICIWLDASQPAYSSQFNHQRWTFVCVCFFFINPFLKSCTWVVVVVSSAAAGAAPYGDCILSLLVLFIFLFYSV